MLNRLCRTINYRCLIQNGRHIRHMHIFPTINGSCLCRRAILDININSFLNNNINLRVHSSISNSRRQKVVLETSTPKIVLDKINLDNKLPNQGTIRNKFIVWKDAADPYMKLMRIDKPIGTWLLFWPCSWSIALAASSGTIPLSDTLYYLGLFLAGSFVMRGAGCTINDLWDRDIDARVERTKDRPLVSGAISQKQAIIFLGTQLSVGLAILCQLNWFSIALGASSMALVVTYPLAKRFTNYPQIFLGATFNWGALLGWSAMQGGVEPHVCLPLYIGSLLWTVVYDTIYAHQDKTDDARIGIKSTALTFGDKTKSTLTACGFTAATCLTAAGVASGMQWPYYLAILAATSHVGRQIYTLDVNDPADCANKFKSNSLVGLIIFLGIVGGGWTHYLKN